MLLRAFLVFLFSFSLSFAQSKGISFTNTDIRDVVKALSVAHNVNIVVDQDVDLKVTIYIQNLPLQGILNALTGSYDLVWIQEGDLYRIKKSYEKPVFLLEVSRDTIKSLRVKNVKLKDFVEGVSQKTGLSILAEKGLKGEVNGTLNAIPAKEGLKTLFEVNGYTFNKKGDVYYVGFGDNTDAAGEPGKQNKKVKSKFDLQIEDGKVNMNLSGADLGEVLNELAEQTGLNIITYGQIRGEVDATLTNIPVREVISRILAGTIYTYSIDQNILLVGERNVTTPSGQALSISKLIHLKHIKAENIPTLLPKSIPSGNVQVVKEQNGILVMGTQDLIKQVEDFLKEIDIPTPQISIEAVIVEFLTDEILEHGIRSKSKGTGDTTGIGGTYIPGLSITTDRLSIEKQTGFKFGTIGVLPPNFSVSLKALETEKLAKVLARPKIATLNGYKASINVGTTSYFKVTTGNVETPLSRFQEINSGIKLDITPWISKSGQITAEIAPEVSNTGAINSEGFPDVARRTMSTTVRLNDGETIVIGGLIKSEERKTVERVPFLGKIPLLGWFFRSTLKSNVKSELLVYVTPHIITESDYVDLDKEMERWDVEKVAPKKENKVLEKGEKPEKR